MGVRAKGGNPESLSEKRFTELQIQRVEGGLQWDWTPLKALRSMSQGININITTWQATSSRWQPTTPGIKEDRWVFFRATAKQKCQGVK